MQKKGNSPWKRSHSTGFGQGHHIRHWAQGGPTTLSNLALLCRRHHRAVHEEGLHARTATPGWLGERLNVVWAIDVLHPLAR